MLFCFIVEACTSMNPYYGLHLSDRGYNEFFEAHNVSQQFVISSENEIGDNEFYYTFPDSLGGNDVSGDAVVETILSANDNSIIAVNLLGMTLYNKVDSSFIGYDKFYAGSKRIITKPGKDVKRYLPFITQAAKNLNYEYKKSNKNKQLVAYCKFHFNEKVNVKQISDH